METAKDTVTNFSIYNSIINTVIIVIPLRIGNEFLINFTKASAMYVSMLNIYGYEHTKRVHCCYIHYLLWLFFVMLTVHVYKALWNRSILLQCHQRNKFINFIDKTAYLNTVPNFFDGLHVNSNIHNGIINRFFIYYLPIAMCTRQNQFWRQILFFSMC